MAETFAESVSCDMRLMSTTLNTVLLELRNIKMYMSEQDLKVQNVVDDAFSRERSFNNTHMKTHTSELQALRASLSVTTVGAESRTQEIGKYDGLRSDFSRMFKSMDTLIETLESKFSERDASIASNVASVVGNMMDWRLEGFMSALDKQHADAMTRQLGQYIQVVDKNYADCEGIGLECASRIHSRGTSRGMFLQTPTNGSSPGRTEILKSPRPLLNTSPREPYQEQMHSAHSGSSATNLACPDFLDAEQDLRLLLQNTHTIPVTQEGSVSATADTHLTDFGTKRQTKKHSKCTSGTNRIFNECHIPELELFNDDGEIANPPSALTHIFGPQVESTKAQLKKKMSWCNAYKESSLSRFVKGGIFSLLGNSVILLNFVFIIFQSDYKVSHPMEEEPGAIIAVGYCFTAYYMLELSLNLMAQGTDFFVGGEFVWNMFDTAIVLIAIIETVAKLLGGAVMNTSFLRVFRFFKLSKILRMFSAIRMFKEIRIMLDALVGCFTLFLFCSLILAIFFCIFAIFFVQGAATFLENSPSNEVILQDIHEYFGTVTLAMQTLYRAATGGTEWGPLHDIVKEFGVLYSSLFLVFVTSYIFAIHAVVTATFCEKAICLAVPNTDELIHTRRRKEHSDAKELLDLLYRFIDDEGSKTISKQQFGKLIAHPEIQVYFLVRGMNPSSAVKFFTTMCDIYKSDTVDFSTFVSSCVRLDGVASGIDMHCLGVRQLSSFHQVLKAQNAQHSEVLGIIKDLRDNLQQGIIKTHKAQRASVKTDGRKLVSVRTPIYTANV